MLQFDVAPGVTQIPDGLAVIARAPDGTPIHFETGTGLAAAADRPGDRRAARDAAADRGQRALEREHDPALLVRRQPALPPAGATQMYVLGRGYEFQPGQKLLIETQAETTADPPLRQIVQLTDGRARNATACSPGRRMRPGRPS